MTTVEESVDLACEQIAAASGLLIASVADSTGGGPCPEIRPTLTLLKMVLCFAASGHILASGWMLKSFTLVPISTPLCLAAI